MRMVGMGYWRSRPPISFRACNGEKWHDRIPDNYYCQILHYLAVTEYEFAVLKARLKSEWKGELIIKEKHYFIERSEVEEDIKMLVEAERRFWECVESGHRPDLILPAI